MGVAVIDARQAGGEQDQAADHVERHGWPAMEQQNGGAHKITQHDQHIGVALADQLQIFQREQAGNQRGARLRTVQAAEAVEGGGHGGHQQYQTQDAPRQHQPLAVHQGTPPQNQGEQRRLPQRTAPQLRQRRGDDRQGEPATGVARYLVDARHQCASVSPWRASRLSALSRCSSPCPGGNSAPGNTSAKGRFSRLSRCTQKHRIDRRRSTGTPSRRS